MKRISIRAYAKHRGVTQKAVQEAIKYGRITKGKDGKIEPVKADKEWAKNTNPALARGKAVVQSSDSKIPDYNTSRAIHEAFDARLAKLKYEEQSKKLIDAEKVKRGAFEIARITRDSVLSIPDRISAELVGITDQATMHSVLTKELTNALQEIIRVNTLP